MVIWFTQERKKCKNKNASLSNYSNAFMLPANRNPVYAYENGNRIYDGRSQQHCSYDFGDGTYSTRMGGFSNQNAVTPGLMYQTLNDNFNGRGTININIIDGFKATANIGYDLMNQIFVQIT